jgi:hypothetical protein
MEAIRSSETSVNKISTRRHIPVDGILYKTFVWYRPVHRFFDISLKLRVSPDARNKIRLRQYFDKSYSSIKSNFAVEWSALLLSICEVPNSNLRPQTCYPDCSLLWFSSYTPSECRDSTSSQNRFLPHSFQFSIYQLSYHSTLYILSYLSRR